MATLYELMKAAWTTNDPSALDREAERMARQGVAETEIYSALEELLLALRDAGLEEEADDRINDVMDRVTGWCHPSCHIRTVRNTLPSEEELAEFSPDIRPGAKRSLPLEAKGALTEVVKKQAAEVWGKQSHLLKLLGRVWDFFRGRLVAHPILILGPSGTGKTALARVLTGDINALTEPPEHYEPSLVPESVLPLGETDAELVVLPGAAPRQGWSTVTADIVNGKYRGLILVVDYGYHAIQSERVKEHHLFETGKKKEFVPKLLSENRRREIEFLDHLLPSLKAVTGKLWVLVVVLKQDLWVSDQAKVVRHYQEGEWGSRMNELQTARGDKSFYLHTVYCSLHIQNYTTRGGHETLQKTAAGYDTVRQRQSLGKLLQVFDSLWEWEKQR